MGLDPFSYLTDFITDPDPGDIAYARRMALRMTSKVPDLYESAVLQDDLCLRIEAVVAHRRGNVHDLFDLQQEARELLLRVKRMGKQ